MKIKRNWTEDTKEGVLFSFWYMLQECEVKAIDEDDILLKIQVEGFYRQWNFLTNSNQRPRWIKD